MKTFKLHLIRHGLTQGNLEGIYVGGGLDVPLAPEGERQLEELKHRYEYPPVGLVFSSPMQRAVQTAEILYPAVREKIVLEELRENVFGEFEGQEVSKLQQNPDFAKWLDPQSDFVPKGGESGREFSMRTAGILPFMMEYLIQHGIGEAACVTHGGVIMSMLSQQALPRKPYPEWMADNGCGFTVQTSAAMLMRDGLVEAVGIVPRGYLD